MIIIYGIGIVAIVAILAAVLFSVVSRVRNGKPHSGGSGKKQDELNEEQAAITASTWTSINPPS